jgi:hypothetical protein
VVRFAVLRKNIGSAGILRRYSGMACIEKVPRGDVKWDIGPGLEYRAVNTEKASSLNSEEALKHYMVVRLTLTFWSQGIQSPGTATKKPLRLVPLQLESRILYH